MSVQSLSFRLCYRFFSVIFRLYIFLFTRFSLFSFFCVIFRLYIFLFTRFSLFSFFCVIFRLLSQVSFLLSVCACWCSSTILEKILSKKVRFSPSVNASKSGSLTATTFRYVCCLAGVILNLFRNSTSANSIAVEKFRILCYNNK